eukprot:TRINITY_DN11179_c3_g1_i1.p1 TRINITY_DN11179_c3_g1~~TRINITY_DN11179_c3_g1_i1.p1  ORF type:complete len:475 (+),score=114.78 TRINITY_DN11179_c3_g1_i1:117-1427(+)
MPLACTSPVAFAPQRRPCEPHAYQPDAVEAVRTAWSMWVRAMAEGWVAEYVDQFMTDDVVLIDRLQSTGRPHIRVEGKAQICGYYDKVRERQWGRSALLTWKACDFHDCGDGLVRSEFDIDVTRGGGSNPRQLWDIRVNHQGKITSMFATKRDSVRRQGPQPAAAAHQQQQQQADASSCSSQHGSDSDADCGRSSAVNRMWRQLLSSMAEGRFTEWIRLSCTPDFVFTDCIGQPPRQLRGHDAVCRYYNKVVERRWSSGVTWAAESFRPAAAPWTVLAVFNLQQGPDGPKTRQFWYVRMGPDGRAAAASACLSEHPSCVPVPTVVPPEEAAGAGAGVGAAEAAGSAGAMCPCTHNSWDNLRVKRGWVVLRCRVCCAQWRRRPQDISRCPLFGRPHSQGCPKGPACEKMHINFTRKAREEVLRKRQQQADGPRCSSP